MYLSIYLSIYICIYICIIYIYTIYYPYYLLYIGPNTRSTQLFIAYEYLDFLGKEPWEIPFGIIIKGNSIVDNIYKGYGDIPPFGTGPNQQILFNQGNKYIKENFPLTDFIYSTKILNQEIADKVLYPEIVVKYLRSNNEEERDLREKKEENERKEQEELESQEQLKLVKETQEKHENIMKINKLEGKIPNSKMLDGSLYKWDELTTHAKSKYIEVLKHPHDNHEIVAILLVCIAVVCIFIYYIYSCGKISSKKQ